MQMTAEVSAAQIDTTLTSSGEQIKLHFKGEKIVKLKKSISFFVCLFVFITCEASVCSCGIIPIVW